MSERDNKRGSSDRRRPGGKPEKDRSENRKSDDTRRPDSRKRTPNNEERENRSGNRSTARKYSTGKPFGERSPDRNTRRPDSRKRTSESDGDGNKTGARPTARKYFTGTPFDDGSSDINTERPDLRKRKPGKDGETNAGGRPAVRKYAASKPFGYRGKRAVADVKNDGSMRLNKYISNSGICSRREADELIKTGLVEVNGKPITEMGYKVKLTDDVRFDGRRINPEPNTYVLLNKPKGFATTDSNEKGMTVMDLVANATSAKIKPFGRLGRNATGLLLFTNDDEFVQKFTKKGIPRLFHIELDKNLKAEHLKKIKDGLTIEGKEISVDEISYVDNSPKSEIGLKIKYTGNSVIRTIFEHLGYDVVRVDCVTLGPLTKKDLPRGRWRILTPRELDMFSML